MMPVVKADRFPSDLSSRAGACGLPAEVDVHRLYADTPTYGERARKLPAGEHEAETGRGVRRWLEWPRGKQGRIRRESA